MKYPNLTEVYRWHPYSDATFADHAGITIRLFHEVIEGDEFLEFMEMYNIGRLIGMPLGALFCPKLIMLNKDNYKHRNMANGIAEALECMNKYRAEGNKGVIRYIDMYNCDAMCESFLNAFANNKATYSRYIGVKARIDSTLLFIRCDEHNRILRDLPTNEKAL